MMNETGIPVSRWIDGVLEDKDNMDQPDKVRAMVLWGHAPNSQTRMVEMKKAMEEAGHAGRDRPVPDRLGRAA
jgi:formate dehydrogenase major subunit